MKLLVTEILAKRVWGLWLARDRDSRILCYVAFVRAVFSDAASKEYRCSFEWVLSERALPVSKHDSIKSYSASRYLTSETEDN
jgi:hypothetical protein